MVTSDPLAVIARDLPVDGTTVSKTFSLQLVDEEVEARTSAGPLRIRQLSFEVTMSSVQSAIPIARVLRYGDDATATAVAERETEFVQGIRMEGESGFDGDAFAADLLNRHRLKHHHLAAQLTENLDALSLALGRAGGRRHPRRLYHLLNSS